jgi:hypothetical protein
LVVAVEAGNVRGQWGRGHGSVWLVSWCWAWWSCGDGRGLRCVQSRHAVQA